MWQMLTAAPGELRIELLEHEAGDSGGSAHWRAHYKAAARLDEFTGRP
jgi:hypothetical protein